MNLDRVGTHPLGDLGGKELGHGGFFQAGLAGILECGGMQDQLACCLKAGGHVGQSKLHRLMLEDRHPEGLAFLGIAQRGFEGGARHAKRLRRNADAPALEPRQRDLVALAFVAKQILGRHPTALEGDLGGVRGMLADLILQPCHPIARCDGGHQKGRDAALAGGLVCDCHDDRDIGMLARGDELLDPVDHIRHATVCIGFSPGGGAQRRGIRPDMRLGQAKGAQHLAAGQRRQPPRFLCLVGVSHQDRGDRTVVDRDDRRGGAAAGRDLLDDHRECGVVETRAAPALGHGHAITAERCQPAQGVCREARLAVPSGSVGCDLGSDKGAHRIAHLGMFGRQDHRKLVVNAA